MLLEKKKTQKSYLLLSDTAERSRAKAQGTQSGLTVSQQLPHSSPLPQLNLGYNSKLKFLHLELKLRLHLRQTMLNLKPSATVKLEYDQVKRLSVLDFPSEDTSTQKRVYLYKTA